MGVPDVIGALAVWRQNTQKKNIKVEVRFSGGVVMSLLSVKLVVMVSRQLGP